VVSLWEMAVKDAKRGTMPVTAAQALLLFNESGYILLNVEPRHVPEPDPIKPNRFDR
jgi:hypothetical protein